MCGWSRPKYQAQKRNRKELDKLSPSPIANFSLSVGQPLTSPCHNKQINDIEHVNRVGLLMGQAEANQNPAYLVNGFSIEGEK